MSKQQEYPYIGKHYLTDTFVFFHAPREGVLLKHDGSAEEYRVDWLLGIWVDVTEQHLQNKDIPVESPAHSEYIQRMAFRYGYRWTFHEDEVANTDMKNLNLWKNKSISCGQMNTKCFTELRLPLPPTSTQTSPLEVGTPVLANGNIGTIKLPKDNSNYYVVLLDDGVYTIAHESEVEELSQDEIHQHKIKSRLEEILLPYVDDISVCDDIMNEFTLEEKQCEKQLQEV